ncbi:unnamed protein product [Somion occarium]|uniref:F-box domain-containing protein n=1 Tax=Somion occarium TaxID=3059160 RepID=A0ABP1CSH2_9APHY
METSTFFESVPLNDSDSTSVHSSASVNLGASATSPTLNFDVLDYLMRIMNRRSLLRMLRTCRTLYASGIPILLGAPIVPSARNIKGFCHFILADQERCGALIRDLMLSNCYRDTECTNDLIRILGVSIGLRRLHMSHLSSLSLSAPTVLATAITLPNVHKLELSGIDCLTQPFLERATILANHLKLFHSSLAFSSPLTELSIHRACLHTLAVWKFEFGGPGVAPFPHLRELRMEDINYEDLSAERLVYVFPNLTKLSIDSLSQHDLPRHRELRLANQQAQRRMSWKELIHVEGTLRALHALGLMCPIRCLKPLISDTNWELGETTNEILQTVISDCRPTALEVTVGNLDDLQKLLQMHPHKPYLTHLSLA